MKTTHAGRLYQLGSLPLLVTFLSATSLSALGATRLPQARHEKVSHTSMVVPAAEAELRVGSLTLHRCPDAPGYCGTLPRPMDPTGQVRGTISIALEFYPHRDTTRPAAETIVANEGGPGYPSSGTRDSYLSLFQPLLDGHDLLLVDQRGTGKSQAIDCKLLQSQPTPEFPGITQCGALLGNTSDLYSSGLAADDLAAVLDALGISIINLYGDSYGTFFSQTFAGRHPERLRAAVLDSAYPVIGQSPWYPEAAPAARQAFEYVCQRSAACRNIPGNSWVRIEALLESLRAHPFKGWAHDGNGVMRYTPADAPGLAYLMFSNQAPSLVYRELDPAARAYLGEGDSAPLLRLLAENYTVSKSAGPSTPPATYSAGLFVAVSCSDYPQVYDMTSPPAARIAQRNNSFAEEERSDPNVYEPFTIAEFNAMPLDTSVLDLCLPWPAPSAAYPPGQPVPPHARFTPAPVLVLSGDLDSLTPAAQGTNVARLFPHAQQIIVENSFHVTALDDQDNCASEIVRRFVRDLDPGDTSCAANIAEVRMMPRFVATAAEVDPAAAVTGNRGTTFDLRVAAAAAYTVGDALGRWWVNSSGDGVGLRGGKFHYDSSSNPIRYTLDRMKWVKDVLVSGTMNWDYNFPGTTVAKVRVSGPGTEDGQLEIKWNGRQQSAQATITGTIGKRRIAAVMYAP